jgi:hypothetical protein
VNETIELMIKQEVEYPYRQKLQYLTESRSKHCTTKLEKHPLMTQRHTLAESASFEHERINLKHLGELKPKASFSANFANLVVPHFEDSLKHICDYGPEFA